MGQSFKDDKGDAGKSGWLGKTIAAAPLLIPKTKGGGDASYGGGSPTPSPAKSPRKKKKNGKNTDEDSA
jgi:hypothetical protein